MAATVVSAGTPGKRDGGTGNVTVASFTSANDDFLLALIHTEFTGTADSITSHDGGSSWIQIGTEVTLGGRSASIWGCFSTGATSTAVAASSTSGGMCMSIEVITGADVSGTVANALKKTDSNTENTSSPSLDLTGATSPTIHLWGLDQASVSSQSSGSTLLDDRSFRYGAMRNNVEWDSSADTAPNISISATVNTRNWGVEIKEAGGGGATNPKGPFTHPLYGTFRGPIS